MKKKKEPFRLMTTQRVMLPGLTVILVGLTLLMVVIMERRKNTTESYTLITVTVRSADTQQTEHAARMANNLSPHPTVSPLITLTSLSPVAPTTLLPSPPTPTQQHRETIKIGQILPHLPMTFENGEEMTLMDYQHTTMIVNFTATWCQPCLDMLPAMNDLQVAYTPEQLQVISVMSFDDEVDFAALRDKFPLAYPLAKANVRMLPDDYDIPAIPLTLIVSRDHIIRAVFLGSKDQATLEAALEQWMTTQ